MLGKAPMGPQWLEEDKTLSMDYREIPMDTPYTHLELCGAQR